MYIYEVFFVIVLFDKITFIQELWIKAFIPIILSFIFNIFSIGVSIGYLFPGQVNKFLEWNWPHWASKFVSAVSTILGAAIFNLIFSTILVPIFQAQLFDTTLKACGLEQIFVEEEERHTPYYIVLWRKFRSSILVMWFLLLVKVKREQTLPRIILTSICDKVLLVVLTSPLQLVPVLGNVIACYIIGWPTA